jgi:AraC family L-rhamnose operon transcriptional activator RhaR
VLEHLGVPDHDLVPRCRMQVTTLDAPALQDCLVHLDALDRLRLRPLGLYRSDIISHLTLVLGHLARAVAADRDRLVAPTGPAHPAVVQAMRLLDSQLTHQWTLGELAARLHLSPGYLLRLFKSSTGMPPMTYLARPSAGRTRTTSPAASRPTSA